MKYRYRNAGEESDKIDIHPLIDVVFILLIFFMVSTTFVKDMNLDIDRPKASSASQADSNTIRVYIDGNGNTFLDGQPVRTWVIQSRLRDMLQVSSSKNVLVVTDDKVPAGKLVQVVDQAKLAGAEDVGVSTQASGS
ncbi:ExbD/TolR family protein [Thiohalorhabdus sp. Cl-TMA]|uniref:ExbD/TolR family protein n=1 Tax=Thiohalorhabdus methylotrophus TaxID=3242694 RepID=A0ABV4TTV9_9GAMM